MSGINSFPLSDSQISSAWQDKQTYEIENFTYRFPIVRVVCNCRLPPPPAFIDGHYNKFSEVTNSIDFASQLDNITIFELEHCELFIKTCE